MSSHFVLYVCSIVISFLIVSLSSKLLAACSTRYIISISFRGTRH
ncbi:unnamed protein product, partial [Brassica rapa]